MSYVLWANHKGKRGQVSYTFEVKGREKGKRFVFDRLGWYKINFFSGASFGFNVNQRFYFLNINKFIFWSMRGLEFKPKAFKLIFNYCLFLVLEKIEKKKNISKDFLKEKYPVFFNNFYK